VFFNALWLYAARIGELLEGVVSEQRIRVRTQRYLLGPLVYGITIPLAFVEPWISIAMYTALAAFYLIPLPEE
jgi:TMEM175 potassium channel family protein